MTQEDEWEKLCRWIEIRQQSPHASAFSRRNTADKKVIELCVAKAWANSMLNEYGFKVSIVNFGDDPPDLWALVDGRNLGVELVELVDGEAKAKAKAHVSGKGMPKSFEDLQWTIERFESAIAEILDQKQVKYSQSNLQVDVVVIHTDETWLRAPQMRQWLGELKFKPRSCLERVYLIRTHEPGELGDWALFRIY